MKETLQNIQSELLPAHARLVAVSKTRSVVEILDLYHQGQKAFGENRVQELVPKYEALPKDIEWHLIGHLQTNKVRYIASCVHLIHSVDSSRLLEEINRQAKKNRRIIPCLLQIHIAREETKFGMDENELNRLLEELIVHPDDYRQVQITGLMGMATNTDNKEQVRNEFQYLKGLFDSVKQKYFPHHPYFKELSMGMSADYRIAIEEGSTMVRIGSLLFGER